MKPHLAAPAGRLFSRGPLDLMSADPHLVTCESPVEMSAGKGELANGGDDRVRIPVDEAVRVADDNLGHPFVCPRPNCNDGLAEVALRNADLFSIQLL